MEIQVMVETILPDETWQSSKDGSTQTRHGFVGKTLDQYSKMMKFDVFGEDKWGKMNLQVGSIYVVKFDATSREYNGKWFTSLTAWSAFQQGGQGNNAQAVQQQSPIPNAKPAPAPQPQQAPQSDNDLPF